MRTKLVSALLALALVASGAALGAPTDVVQSQETTAAANDAPVEFGDDRLTVERGGSVTIPVLFDGTDRATVKIGSEETVNYALVVTVEDGNGDGRVEVTFDTDAVGEPNATKVTTEASADGATVESEVEHFDGEPPYPALARGAYPVMLYEGTGTDRTRVEKIRMSIVEASTTTEATETTSTLRDATETTSEATATTTDAPETTHRGTADTPGFGPGPALVALAAAATLFARR